MPITFNIHQSITLYTVTTRNFRSRKFQIVMKKKKEIEEEEEEEHEHQQLTFAADKI